MEIAARECWSKSLENNTRYQVQESLGSGAMGDVTKVIDLQLEREVAVKSLQSKHLNNADSVARFMREARTTGQLQHPNIPAVHDLGETSQGNPYFTMALVQGETLSAIIDRLRQGDLETHKIFTFARRMQMIQLVCDAIHYAHSRGFLHRDLKPDNIMVGPFGEVQVMDWGLVRRMSGHNPKPRMEKITQVGTFVGTPAYAAPEQIAGETDALDARTDVYGLGALLYELCTLHPPHGGKSARETILSVMTKSPPKPESYQDPIQGRVPRELSVVIVEALAMLPDERMSTALDLKLRLQKILEGDAPVVCPHTAFKRGVTRLQRFLDNHHSPLTVALVYLWALSPIFLLAYVLWNHYK